MNDKMVEKKLALRLLLILSDPITFHYAICQVKLMSVENRIWCLRYNSSLVKALWVIWSTLWTWEHNKARETSSGCADSYFIPIVD